MRAYFVRDPVSLRIPKRPGFDTDNVEARAREALQEYAAGGAHADDDIIHFVFVLEPPHGDMNRLERAKHVLAILWRFEGSQYGLFQWVPPPP
jgi:hypothetical protein